MNTPKDESAKESKVGTLMANLNNEQAATLEVVARLINRLDPIMIYVDEPPNECDKSPCSPCSAVSLRIVEMTEIEIRIRHTLEKILNCLEL